MNWNLRMMLMGGLLLVTLGPLLLLDNLEILYFRETTWPLLLVAIGVGLFLWNRRTLAGWIIGGIGIIFFVVNFVIFFFPGFEDWTFLVGPIILIIIGVLLLYRSYHDSRHPLVPPETPPRPEETQRPPEGASQDLRRSSPLPPDEEAKGRPADADQQPRQ